jgi:hypothetical protein
LLSGLATAATTVAVNLGDFEPSYRALQFGGGDGAQVASRVRMRQQLLGALARGLGVRFVNVGGALGVIRENRHDVVVDFEEAACDEEALLDASMAHAQLARIVNRPSPPGAFTASASPSKTRDCAVTMVICSVAR